MKKRATIYDIAEKAGVSPMTVSRALRSGPKKYIRPATILKIESIARKLNYQPHAGARALVLQKQFNIGFCITRPGFNYYDRAQNVILRAMQERLTKQGYRMGFYYFPPDDHAEFDIFLNQHRAVDAIVLHGSLNERKQEIMQRSGVHAISFLVKTPGIHSVILPLADRGKRAAELIWSRGFRKVTLLDFGVHQEDGIWAGFKSKAAELGLKVRTMDKHWDPLYERDYALQEGKPAPDLVDRLLASGEAGRCVFVSQDQYPLKIMQMMIKQGLEPGRDISFVGVGNIEPLGWGPWKVPRLTTFDPQRVKIGCLVADLAMDGGSEPKVHVVPALAVERSSLGWWPPR